MSSSIEAQFQRELTVMDFVTGAIAGDERRITGALESLTWDGAWRAVFEKLALIGVVHPNTRATFRSYWHDFRDDLDQVDGTSGPGIWGLTHDLRDEPELLSAGLKILLPAASPEPGPLALFRGGSTSERLDGKHGSWWTPDPTLAEFYARLGRNSAGGWGEVVAVFDPHDAIICRFNYFEILLDPTKLSDTISIATVPAYTAQESDNLAFMTKPAILRGIPSGHDASGLDRWLALNCPMEGLPEYREERERYRAWHVRQ